MSVMFELASRAITAAPLTVALPLALVIAYGRGREWGSSLHKEPAVWALLLTVPTLVFGPLFVTALLAATEHASEQARIIARGYPTLLSLPTRFIVDELFTVVGAHWKSFPPDILAGFREVFGPESWDQLVTALRATLLVFLFFAQPAIVLRTAMAVRRLRARAVVV